MAEQVDFPALRSSLKAQLGDRLWREVGTPSPDNPFAAFGLSIAGGLVGGMVAVLVTPAGLGAMLEGRRTWDRASGAPPPSSDNARDPSAPRPLQDAQYPYEPPSRSTATVHPPHTPPAVFVTTGRGRERKLLDQHARGTGS